MDFDKLMEKSQINIEIKEEDMRRVAELSRETFLKQESNKTLPYYQGAPSTLRTPSSTSTAVRCAVTTGRGAVATVATRVARREAAAATVRGSKGSQFYTRSASART